ncbi:MAG: mechanosensitive ion channel family protein [Archangium sp.]
MFALVVALVVAAPLTIEEVPVAELRATVNGSTPEQRVQRARERIDALNEDEVSAPAHVAREGDDMLVLVGDEFVFGLTLADGFEDDAALEAGARAAANKLREVLLVRIARSRPEAILKSVAFAVLGTLLFALAILGLIRAWHFLSRRLVVVNVDVKRVGIGPLIRNALRRVVFALMWALGLLLAYLWLTFVLTRFAMTQAWGDALGSNLLSLLVRAGRAIAGSLPGLAMVAVVIVATRFATRVFEALFEAIERGRLTVRGIYPETLKATRRLVIVGAWLFAAILSWPYIPGSDTEAFKGMSVLLGLMLTVGSTGVVNQALSGFVLVYTRALSPGDWVKVGEVEGRVRELGVLSVKVLTPNNREVTIPNAVLVGNPIVNFDRGVDGDGASVSIVVTLGYDTPWRRIHELLLETAKQVEVVREKPKPFVRQSALGNWYVEYELVVHIVENADVDDVRSSLHAKAQDLFAEAKLELMTPDVLDVRRYAKPQ